MPAGVAPQPRGDDSLRAGGFQDFGGAGDAVVQNGPGVVAHGVVNLGRGDAVAVGKRGVDGNAVVFFGQVFGHNDDAHLVAEPFREVAVMSRAPGDRLANEAAQRDLQRRAADVGNLHIVAAHKSPAQVGFVKFLAQHCGTPRPVVRPQILVKESEDIAAGVVHQVAAHLAAAVGQPVGEPGGHGIQQQA